ncbi:DUF4260 family protein [Candidatus Micrarchaeota archaeon]|nr:DUF4260 family protein [Candidatus Micrarchaeota archaeon]
MLDMKKWPSYLPMNHRLYRVEYALLALGFLGLLYWRSLNGGLDVWLTLLLVVLPDAPFLAILPAMKNGRWPSWGSMAYNFTHSYATWLVAAAILWYVPTGFSWWPLLGWAFHISVDRAIGFMLRKPA